MSQKKLTRAERRAQVKRKKQMQSVGIMVLGLLIIASGIVLVSFIKPKLSKAPDYDYSLATGNSIGEPTAPLVIEVFSSFGCIHCRDFAVETEQQVFDNYVKTGKVFFIYRSFNNPADRLGIAAQAAYCAGDQGKFWELHDLIFANFSATGYSDKQLSTMVESLDLDIDQYNSCMESGKYVGTVESDFKLGTTAGVTGTPSFTFNGELTIEGNRDFAAFQAQIETSLAAIGN